MPIRTHVVAILVIIAVPLVFFLYDSRYSTITHTCDAKQTVTLSPNTPGNVHSAEIRLEGAVHQGSVTTEGFPRIGPVPQVFTAGASAAEDYAGEMYHPVVLTFDPAPGARCDLRVTYRLASDLSMLNPLW